MLGAVIFDVSINVFVFIFDVSINVLGAVVNESKGDCKENCKEDCKENCKENPKRSLPRNIIFREMSNKTETAILEMSNKTAIPRR